MSVVTDSGLLFYLACSSPSIKMHTSVCFDNVSSYCWFL